MANSVDEVELPDEQDILREMEADESSKSASGSETESKQTEEEKPEQKEDESKETDKKESKDETEKSEESEKKDEESEEEKEDSEEESEDESEEDSEADEKERAQRGFKDRQAVKKTISDSLAQIPDYQPQTAEELEAEGMDPALARVEALQQEVKLGQIVNELTDLNSSINTDANRVLQEFPVFDPTKKGQYDKAFAEEVNTLWRTMSHFETDPDGRFVTRADYPLYDFFAAAARWRGSGQTRATVQAAKSTERMMSAAEESSSAPEPEKPKSSQDKEDELFLAGLKGEAGTYADQKK